MLAWLLWTITVTVALAAALTRLLVLHRKRRAMFAEISARCATLKASAPADRGRGGHGRDGTPPDAVPAVVPPQRVRVVGSLHTDPLDPLSYPQYMPPGADTYGRHALMRNKAVA